MKIAQTFINKPIITIKEGKKVGKLLDFFLDQSLRTVTAVYTSEDGFLSRTDLLIKQEHIVTLGSDALLVDEAEVVIPVSEAAEYDDFVRRDSLIGRLVTTPGGTNIGRIGDIVLGPNGAIVGFMLSQTYVAGPIAASRAISRDAVIEPDNEFGVMTADLAKAEAADLKVVYESLFAEPTVIPTEDMAAATTA
jgi:sporulation protein YlmC with PRC-barrel domain